MFFCLRLLFPYTLNILYHGVQFPSDACYISLPLILLQSYAISNLFCPTFLHLRIKNKVNACLVTNSVQHVIYEHNQNTSRKHKTHSDMATLDISKGASFCLYDNLMEGRNLGTQRNLEDEIFWALTQRRSMNSSRCFERYTTLSYVLFVVPLAHKMTAQRSFRNDGNLYQSTENLNTAATTWYVALLTGCLVATDRTLILMSKVPETLYRQTPAIILWLFSYSSHSHAFYCISLWLLWLFRFLIHAAGRKLSILKRKLKPLTMFSFLSVSMLPLQLHSVPSKTKCKMKRKKMFSHFVKRHSSTY